MSAESDRKEMSCKRCPFNVAEYCITNECASWVESVHDAEYFWDYEYCESTSKPGWFSDWVIHETVWKDIRVQVESYSGTEETRSVFSHYVLRTKNKVKKGQMLSKAVDRGFCRRLQNNS